MHLAAGQISSAVQNRVAAVVVFGDPDNGDGFPGVLNGRSITFCADGDNICDGGDIILPPHLRFYRMLATPPLSWLPIFEGYNAGPNYVVTCTER